MDSLIAYVPSFRIALPPEPTIVVTTVADRGERLGTTSKSHDVIDVLLEVEQVESLIELQELYTQKRLNLRNRATNRKLKRRELRLKQLEGRIDFIKETLRLRDQKKKYLGLVDDALHRDLKAAEILIMLRRINAEFQHICIDDFDTRNLVEEEAKRLEVMAEEEFRFQSYRRRNNLRTRAVVYEDILLLQLREHAVQNMRLQVVRKTPLTPRGGGRRNRRRTPSELENDADYQSKRFTLMVRGELQGDAMRFTYCMVTSKTHEQEPVEELGFMEESVSVETIDKIYDIPYHILRVSFTVDEPYTFPRNSASRLEMMLSILMEQPYENRDKIEKIFHQPAIQEQQCRGPNDGIVNESIFCHVIANIQMLAQSTEFMKLLRKEHADRPFLCSELTGCIYFLVNTMNSEQNRVLKHQQVQLLFKKLMTLVPARWKEEQQGAEEFFELLLNDVERQSMYAQLKIQTNITTTCTCGHSISRSDEVNFVTLFLDRDTESTPVQLEDRLMKNSGYIKSYKCPKCKGTKTAVCTYRRKIPSLFLIAVQRIHSNNKEEVINKHRVISKTTMQMSNCRKAFRRVGCLIHQGTTRTGRKTNGFSGHYTGLVESLQDRTTYFVNDDLVYDCQQFGMTSQDMYDKYASSISTLLYEKAERPAENKDQTGIQSAKFLSNIRQKSPTIQMHPLTMRRKKMSLALWQEFPSEIHQKDPAKQKRYLKF